MEQHVSILLSTWNGAEHLAAQLESYRAQSHRQWTLRWRDDGSTDGTRAMLAAFDRGAPLADDGRALGPAASFAALLRAHLATNSGGPIAFSDQDDVWLPQKLARGIAALRRSPDRPALYCARQILVDATLRPIGSSPAIRRGPGFPDALTQNIATGCTVMLNEAAQRLVARADPPAGTLHDWWAYLLVTAARGVVVADDEPTILYRQHGRNAVGAPEGRARRAVAAMRRGPGRFMTTFRNNVAALDAMSEVLSPDARQLLAEVRRALEAGPLARAVLLRRHRLVRQTPAETALFRLWFVRG